MQELTIRCACSRSMAPEPRRGAGAYRCGCGARVAVAVTAQPAQCWFDGCDLPPTTKPPIRFCAEHEEETALHVAHLAAKRELWLEAGTLHRPLANYGVPEPTAHTETSSVVYFMRREQLIKIGYSNSLNRRATGVGAFVLARIPGGPVMEAQMHERFAALREWGEWFRPGDELVTYINELRAENGEAPIHA